MIATWMLYLAVVALACAGAAALAEIVLRATGRPRRLGWSLGLAGSLLIPALGLLWDASAEVPAPLLEPATSAVGGIESRGPALGAVVEPGTSRILAVLWMVGSIGVAGWLTGVGLRLRRSRRRWRLDQVDGIAVRRGAGPAVVGVVAPEIVVPGWIDELDPLDRELLLRHEQEHLRGRDPWLNAMADLLVVALPWSPAHWLLRSGLRRTIELDCDARVIDATGARARYGRLLLAVAERIVATPGAALGFGRPRSALTGRITALLDPQPRLSAARLVGVGSGLGALVLLACASPRPAPLEPGDEGPTLATVLAQSPSPTTRIRTSDSTGPMTVMVRDREGRVVESLRIEPGPEGARATVFERLRPEEIESVEVFKGARRAIMVTLKAIVTDVPGWRRAHGLTGLRPASTEIRLEVSPSGQAAINMMPVPVHELGATLARVYQGRPRKELVLRLPPRISSDEWERIARRAGAEPIVTRTGPGGQ